MTSLSDKLSHVVGQVFVDSELPAELGQVRVSDRPDLAQFQCNGAMAAAKLAKKNPRDIANDVVGKLQTQDVFSKVDIAGPGFINIDVTDDFLSAHLEMIRADERLGAGNSGQDQTIVLDYGGPNI
ncbi:MAG TPA: arginine--tRNA ligase, partial [Micavibrio sp.]|nr:arginine--tRNA ligase [Micavibrio sp.]